VINTTLARRYARALVELGQAENALDKYGKDLAALTELMNTSRDLREVLINPVFTKEDKKKIARSLMAKLGVAPMVANFVCVLIDRKRINQLQGIEEAFRSLVDQIRGITRGEIVSADPLSADVLAEVTAVLSRISGKQVVITTRQDPSLIGGLVAKVGDMQFDGTIRTQLNQLKESLKG